MIESQIDTSPLPQWTVSNNRLTRTVDCPTYMLALGLVQQIGLLAEQQDHHPDLLLHYKTLTIQYWTHTANGITQKDMEGATAVEALLQTFEKEPTP